ncbi:MAG: class I SAM-dependent methyltransferase [Nitrospirae bacterium]|nr:class I SAM-dependent methyltransferase [Nitrospirota bacterium]
MTDFIKTNWAKTEFSQNYLEKADIYIVERRRMFSILRSFVSHFLSSSGNKRLLDLGCGDGILTEELLQVDGSLSATLLDGSDDMLAKARRRLVKFGEFRYVKASFQELLEKDFLAEKYDLAVSSMAIHHLTLNEKVMLFNKIRALLKDGGYFVNIDVVLPPTEALDQWYMKLWQEWMDNKKSSLGLEDEPSENIIKRYKDLGENRPDTLEDQLRALNELGFSEVDCFYKYGIFTIFGGKR